MKRKILTDFVKEIFITSGSDSEWFGYYNYDTLNYNRKRLLCNRSKFEGVAPEAGMTIEIGYYDLESSTYCHIGDSDSWNWQQGAMAQWIPGEGNESKVIFNCSLNNHIVSKIVDLDTKEERIINWGIYGLLPSGDKSITIDFERAYWCRTYHYQSVKNNLLDVPVLESDGLFEVDLLKNERKRILSIKDIIESDYDNSFADKKHWIEHVMVSPGGKRVCFLHRFSPTDDTYHYRTRLCICNIDGSNLQVIPGWKEYGLSHFAWNGDDSFCIYSVKISPIQQSMLGNTSSSTVGKSVFTKLKRYIYVHVKDMIPKKWRRAMKGGDAAYSYRYFVYEDGQFTHKDDFRDYLLRIDGHPSFTSDGLYMLTDTYADENGYRHLTAFNIITHKSLHLLSLYEPLVGNPARCDLHPKLCKDNNIIAVDTTYQGKHNMIVFRLNWDAIKKEID